jgi:hypothetical protein
MTKGIGKPVNGGSNEFRGASSEQSTEKNRKEGRPDPSPALSTPSRCRHLPRRAHETFKLRPRRTRKVQAERSVRHGSMMPCRLVVLRHVGVAIPRGVLRRIWRRPVERVRVRKDGVEVVDVDGRGRVHAGRGRGAN